MTLIYPGRTPNAGLITFKVARNGAVTDGASLARVGALTNTLMTRRMHPLLYGGNSIGNYPPSGLTIGGAFHTSPYCDRVECMMIAGRSTSATISGHSRFGINAAFVADTFIGGSISGTTGPQDLSVVRVRLTDGGSDLVGDTDYEFSLEAGSTPISILWFCVYEVPRDFIATAEGATPLDVFQVGAPILDRDIASVSNALWTMHARSGNPQFAFAHSASSAPTATTTYKNILDGSTTGYASNAAGYWTFPYRKNRYASSTADVVLWAVSAVSGTGLGGTVRFTNAAGTIGTLTIVNGSVATATATIDATTSGSQLVVVEHKSTANTITTIAAGMYELI